MPENDPDKPFFVWGRAPEDRTRFILLAANRPWLASLEEDQVSATLAQYAGHVHGHITIRQDREFVCQKVSNGLMSAYALFRGLRRHLIDHRLDERRYAYILNPSKDYGYEESRAAQRGHISKPKPLDSVFAVYVEFGEDAVLKAREWYGQYLPNDTAGVVHKWEWVSPLDPSDESLPAGFATRYDERLW